MLTTIYIGELKFMFDRNKIRISENSVGTMGVQRIYFEGTPEELENRVSNWAPKPEPLRNGAGIVLAECVERDPKDVKPGEYLRHVVIHPHQLRARHNTDYNKWLIGATEWVMRGGTK